MMLWNWFDDTADPSVPCVGSSAKIVSTALVEFGIIVPVLLLFLAVIIDGGRLAWTYQSVAAGVRDASRMVARIAPSDLCPGGSVTGYDVLATQIVEQSVTNTSILPNSATVVDVVPSFKCVTGGYRVDPAAIIEIRAQGSVQLSFWQCIWSVRNISWSVEHRDSGPKSGVRDMTAVVDILRRFGRDTRGTALVEMAIVIPLLLLLIFGILEYGRLFWITGSAQKATAIAARIAAVRPAVCPGVPTTISAASIFADAKVRHRLPHRRSMCQWWRAGLCA